MSTATTTIAPEVQDFLDAVRAQLTDLEPDEQRDITEGLEADLTDLVAERGRGALGDPVAYARELRAAAGLEPQMGRTRVRLDLSTRIHRLLDGSHRETERLIATLPGDAAGFLGALRPAWWVVRGWIAVQAAALALGDWSLTLLPGGELPGAIAVGAGVVLSVQLGRGRIGTSAGWDRNAGLRLVRLCLNVAAVVMIPVVFNGLGHEDDWLWNDGYQAGYADSPDRAGSTPSLSFGGEPVRNIYPYDAQGHPLTGVQLVDSDGHPLTLTNDPYDEGTGWGDFMLVPWLNGKTEQFNVFPLAEQRVEPGSQEPVGVPALQSAPLASLPPVSLAGVVPSLLAPADPGR